MEELVDSVGRESSYHRAAFALGNWFTGMGSVGHVEIIAQTQDTYITFPISLQRAPGLQILIAASRHSRVTRISFSDSASIFPTGYVALRSLWKPTIVTVQ